MSNYIDLDSIRRDREAYPNPAFFCVTADQLVGWSAAARTVKAIHKDPRSRPEEFATSLKLHFLTIPYSDEFAELPRVYVDIHTEQYNDKWLISSIGGANSDARFIAHFDRVQNDADGNGLWIHFKCGMPQVTRFNRRQSLVFRVFSRDGNTLPITDDLPPNPPNPIKQVLATFEIEPYERDGDYTNNMVEPVNM